MKISSDTKITCLIIKDIRQVEKTNEESDIGSDSDLEY